MMDAEEKMLRNDLKPSGRYVDGSICRSSTERMPLLEHLPYASIQHAARHADGVRFYIDIGTGPDGRLLRKEDAEKFAEDLYKLITDNLELA